MSEKDVNDLATNNLLEILRGKKSADEVGKAGSSALEAGSSAKAADTSAKEAAFSDTVTEEKPQSEQAPADLPESDVSEEAGDTKAPKAKRSFDFIPDLANILQNMMQTKKGVLALDIGNDSIKYVTIEQSKGFEKLTGYNMLRIPRDNLNEDPKPEDIKIALGRLLEEVNLSEWDVVTAVSGQKVSIKHISLPKMPKGELANAIIWNAKKELPFPKETAHVDYRILGETEEKGVPKLSVICGIVDEGELNNHLKLLDNFNIVPTKVIPIPLAAFNSYKSQFGAAPLEDGIVIDIGDKNSFIIFINNGIIQFVRELNIGGKEITAGMVGTISTIDGMVRINEMMADRLKQNYGFPDETSQNETEEGIPLMQVSSIVRPTLERLSSQIIRSIDYFRNKFGQEEHDIIYLAGGTALMKNFDVFLSEYTGKDVKLIDPFKTMVISHSLDDLEDLKANAPLFSMCRGIAVKEKDEINLLPAELKMLPKLQEYYRYIKLAVTLTLIIMSVFSFLSYKQYSIAKGGRREISNELNKLSPVTQEIIRLGDDKSAIEGRISLFMNQLSSITSTVDALSILKMLSAETPEYITITSIVIAPEGDRSVIVYLYYNREDRFNAEFKIDQFGIIIQKTGLFSFVETPNEGNAVGETKMFSIKCRL